ncbi:MAG TPA: DUF4397 domain-containing protein [Vicinamibacterales bacterium]|nr:DUF4397 domain-containing protein [Vicinamibacterales bacterium]
MNVRRAVCVLLCLCAVAVALPGCNTGQGVGATAITTRVRVLNLIPNAAGITLTLDTDAPVVTGLGFQQLTQYLNVNPGSREFKVSVDGGATTLIGTTLGLVAGADYTFVVFGAVEAANTVLQFDTNLPIPNGGTFFLRVIDLAAIAGGIDVYLTPLGADISATAPVIANATYLGTTGFVPATAGNFQLRVTPNGTKEVIFDSGTTLSFGDKTLVQVVAFAKGSAKLVNIAVLNLDQDGTGQFVDNLLAEFKLTNASSVGPLNVFVDGVLALANVPFAGVSNYEKVIAGSRTISIQSAATPGANLLTLTPSLAPATDTSIVVSGPAGALQGLVLTDNNLPSAVDHARVRFVNASPDLASMDVYVNFVRLFSAVASNSASPYAELAADTTGTAYEFDFNVAGTTTPALMLPNVLIAAGKTYTVYVVGQGAARQGVVVGDN